jgi:hypothetical protein
MLGMHLAFSGAQAIMSEPLGSWVQTTYLSLFFIFIGLMQLAGVQHFFEKNFKSLNMLY